MASPAETGIVSPGFEISRIIEEHRLQDEKRRVKRAANRKSASTSRARKKAYVDDMTAKNERMKQHALVLSLLPDLVLAVCRTGEMTYVSPACRWLLLHSPEDMTGANIFELVAPECHPVLRKMISDNLSRPVKAGCNGGCGVGMGRDGGPSKTKFRRPLGPGEGDEDDTDPSDDDDPQHPREKMGNHRERLQQRYRQSQMGECSTSGGGGSSSSSSSSSAGSSPPSSTMASFLTPKTKMLRIFRGDKTTVWCETRLSVRNEKPDGNSRSGVAPVPLEIILTLRTVAEGDKTAVAHEFASGNGSMADRDASVSKASAAEVQGVAGVADADADEGSVQTDDDGYQCEVEEEEDSNNSGSGNDSGARSKGPTRGSSKGGRSGVTSPSKNKSTKTPESPAESGPEAADPSVGGREEWSLSKKRQREIDSNANNMDETGSARSEKSGGENSSTGGDTGGSTTFDGSGSCSNEADSNGEGSNNESTSKWGDGDGGGGVAAAVGGSYRKNCGGGSEDGDGTSEDTSAAGTDFGDDVQTAVQSLILMGGDLAKAAAQ